METILYNISQVLGITIIHSLWQGLLIYFALRIIFAAVPSLSPAKKYNLAVGAMVVLFGCFVYTLLAEVSTYNWVQLSSVHVAPLVPYLNLTANQHHFTTSQSVYRFISGYLPYISIIYTIGLLVNITKLGREWNKIRLIKRSVIPAEQMQQFINTFSKKLNIGKHIQLKFSDLIDVPCIIGVVKPIILLPVSIATYLTACEIEAILLHELSHIKRNDYLINLLQQVITVILFFNPFAQLISRILNQERENSCDDLVIGKTGKPLIYAKALLKLEETRGAQLQLALAATGKRYHLLNRIERIMKTKQPIGNIRQLFIAILLLAGGLSSIAWLNPNAAEAKTKKTTASASFSPGKDNAGVLNAADTDKYLSYSDTIKKKHKRTISITDKNGNTKVYETDGELSPEARREFFRQHPDLDSNAFDSLANFYSSRQWKAQMDEMRKQGEEMRKKFESPEWKAQMLAMKKQGEEMKKKFESPEWKAQMEDMKKQGEEMKKKFESPEWKKSMEDMKLQGEEMKKKFESPEWKKSMEDMKLQGEEMKKKFESPEWKKSMEDMKLQGEEMKKKFESPEWKKSMEDMKLQGEEMKKKFESPEWKKSMEDMKLQGEEMRKKFESPEWKAQMEEMKKQGEEMRKKFDSPEWKAQMEEMKKQGKEFRKYMRWDDTTSDTIKAAPKKRRPVKKN